MMRKLALAALMMTGLMAAPKEVSFPSPDGGEIWGDLYGAGDRGVVLAHGMAFNKGSWEKQAEIFAKAGFLVLAIDFRGYGKSHGPNPSSPGGGEKYQDVLAAVRYLRANGVKTVRVIGASMGGGASGNALIHARPGEIDRLVLLANVPVEAPERLTGPKLFVTSRGDRLAPKVREQFEKAPEPKELLLLDGSAHAQHLFETDQGERLMNKLLEFLSKP
jgi:pimeloyl-ACP methyl ester carboxylesterase